MGASGTSSKRRARPCGYKDSGKILSSNFGKEFEEKYIGQGPEENRTMEETLNLGWELLGRLPKEELDRVDTKILEKYYHPTVYDDTTTATSSPGSIANQK